MQLNRAFELLLMARVINVVNVAVIVVIERE